MTITSKVRIALALISVALLAASPCCHAAEGPPYLVAQGTPTTGGAAPPAGVPSTGTTASPLQVVQSIPQRNAVNVPANTQIIVTFNQSVRAKSGGTAGTFAPTTGGAGNTNQMLRVAGSNQWVAGKSQITQDGKVVVFVPSAQLGQDTQYEIVLDSWESLQGAQVSQSDRIIPFKTGHGVVQVVQLIEPAKDAALPTDTPPTFRWQMHPSATGYMLAITDKVPTPDMMPSIGKPEGPSNDKPPLDGFLNENYGVLRIQVSGQSPTPVTLTAGQWNLVKGQNKPLYWAVRAVTGPSQTAGDVYTTSEYRKFTVGGAAGALSIILVSPGDFAQVSTLLPTFEWKLKGTMPKNATYRLAVLEQINKPPIYQAETMQTSLTYDELALTQLVKGGNYAWQVALIGSNNQVLAKSDIGKFRVGALPDIALVTPRTDQGKKLLASDPVFKWQPPMGMNFPKYRLTITQVAGGNETPILTENGTSTPKPQFGYLDAAQVLKEKSTYRWKIEGLDDSDQVVAQSTASDFQFELDQAAGDLEIVSVKVFDSRGHELRQLPGVKLTQNSVFTNPSENVEFRVLIRNPGAKIAKGHTLELGKPMASLPSDTEIKLLDSSPAKVKLTPGGGEVLVAVQQNNSSQSNIPVPEEFPNLNADSSMPIPDVAPGTQITLSIHHLVADSVINGTDDPVRVAIDSPMTAKERKRRDFSIFNLFGFRFTPDSGSGAVTSQQGGGFFVTGIMEMERQDFIPRLGESGTPWVIPMRVQVSSGAKVVAGRLKQNTHITLWRFSTDLADGIVAKPKQFEVVGQLTVPYSKGNQISLSFGKPIADYFQIADQFLVQAVAQIASPDMVGSPSGTFQYWSQNAPPSAQAASAYATGGNSASNTAVGGSAAATQPADFSGSLSQGAAGMPASENESLILTPEGTIWAGQIAIPSFAHNRPLVTLEGYEGPRATLTPWTIYLGWRGLLLTGPTREEVLPEFELNPSLPMGLPCHGTGESIVESLYDAAALQLGLHTASLSQAALAQASQDYMITAQAQFGGMDSPYQSQGMSTLNQDYLNAVLGDLSPASPDATIYFQTPYCPGGLIHYCEGDAVEAWWLDIENNLSRFAGYNWWRGGDQPWWHSESLSGYLNANGFKAKNMAFDPWAWWPGEHRASFAIDEAQHQVIGTFGGGPHPTQQGGKGGKEGLSNLADQVNFMGGTAWGEAQSSTPDKPAEPDPGNHISGSNVAMDNVGLLFRRVKVAPNRTLEPGGKVYSIYDMAYIDESGVHMSANATERLPLPDEFYVGDFKIKVTSKSNPGAGVVTLPGAVDVTLALKDVGVVQAGSIYKATSGTITPNLPGGGLPYNFGGYALVVSGIGFQLGGYDPGLYLTGKLQLPKPYTASGGTPAISFSNVKITSNGRFIADACDFKGQSFGYGMFTVRGKAGSKALLNKMESDATIGIKISSFRMAMPGPSQQSETAVDAALISVKPNGLAGTITPPGAFDIGAGGFKVNLSGASIGFATEPSAQVHVQADMMSLYGPGGAQAVISLNHQGFDLESPAAWAFHLAIGGAAFGAMKLSDGALLSPVGSAVIDLTPNWGDGAHASEPAWMGISLGGAGIVLPGFGGKPDLSLDCTGGVDMAPSGLAGSLSSSGTGDKNWNPGGFALKFPSAGVTLASNAVSKVAIPSAALTLPSIGEMPLQNIVIQPGSGLIPSAGSFAGSQALALYGFGLTLQSGEFTNQGFKITGASLAIGSSPVAVTGVTFNGKGEIVDGSISFTGPATFPLGNGKEFACQVTAQSGQLDSSGLGVNGSVGLTLPKALQPMKPAGWPDDFGGKFSGIKFNSALCVAANQIGLDVGTPGKNYVDSTGVVLGELKTALPAVGDTLVFGGFKVKLTSVTGANFLNVGGTADFTLPTTFPVTAGNTNFAFSGVAMDQQGGWHVTSGSADVVTTPLDLALPGGFKLGVSKLKLDADGAKNQLEGSIKLPGALLENAADVVQIPFGMAGLSPTSNLYAEGIAYTGPFGITGGIQLSQITNAVVDFAAAQSPGGKPNAWQGVFLSAGKLALPAGFGNLQQLGFTNVAMGTDGLSGAVALSADPPISFSISGLPGFAARFGSGTLNLAGGKATLSFSGDLLLPSGVFPGSATLPLTNVAVEVSGGATFYTQSPWSGALDILAGMKLQSGSGTNVLVDASATQSPAGKPNNWEGVLVSTGSVALPSPFEGANADFTNLEIGSAGITGQLNLKTQCSVAIPFGSDSFNVSLSSGTIVMVDNQITSSSIGGEIGFPATFQKVGGGQVSIPFTGLALDMSGPTPSFGFVFASLKTTPPMTFAGFALDLGTTGLGLDLSSTGGIANYTDAPFRGVVLYGGAMKLTKLFGGNIEIPFKFKDLVIGASGLTGTLYASNIPQITLPLMPTYQFGLSSGRAVFEQNAVTELVFAGRITLPSAFTIPGNQPAKINFDHMALSMSGDFSIQGAKLPVVNVGGFSIASDDAAVDYSATWTPTNSKGFGADWRGVYLHGGKIVFPTSRYVIGDSDPLTVPLTGAYIATDGKLAGDGGISSPVTALLSACAGMDVTFNSGVVQIANNAWQHSSFSGCVSLPTTVLQAVYAMGARPKINFANAELAGNGDFYKAGELDPMSVFRFEIVQKAVQLDYSETQSPQVSGPLVPSGGMMPSDPKWRGVFLALTDLKLPMLLKREGVASPPIVKMVNFFVDGKGATGQADFNGSGNLLGGIAGFPFQLDSFKLIFAANVIQKGDASIRLSLPPLMETKDTVGVNVTFSETGIATQIATPGSAAPMHNAVMSIDSLIFQNPNQTPRLVISGKLMLNAAQTDQPIGFTDLPLNPAIIASEQWLPATAEVHGTFRGFDVVVDGFGVGTKKGKLFFGITGDVSVSAGGMVVCSPFKAAICFDNTIDAEKVVVDSDWKGLFQVKGEVDFHEEGTPSPGGAEDDMISEFRGDIPITLDLGGPVGFGISYRIGHKGPIYFCGFSAEVTMPTPIQLSPLPIAIYSFLGGFAKNIAYTPGVPGQSILNGQPADDTYVFQAGIGVCTSDQYLVHGPVTLTVQIAGDALSLIAIEGTFYLCSGLGESPDNRWAKGQLVLDMDVPSFTAAVEAQLYYDLMGVRIIEVKGNSGFYISPDELKMYLGTPENKISVEILNSVDADGYCMLQFGGGQFSIAFAAGWDFGFDWGVISAGTWFTAGGSVKIPELQACGNYSIGGGGTVLGCGGSVEAGCNFCIPPGFCVYVEVCTEILWVDVSCDRTTICFP